MIDELLHNISVDKDWNVGIGESAMYKYLALETSHNTWGFSRTLHVKEHYLVLVDSTVTRTHENNIVIEGYSAGHITRKESKTFSSKFERVLFQQNNKLLTSNQKWHYDGWPKDQKYAQIFTDTVPKFYVSERMKA